MLHLVTSWCKKHSDDNKWAVLIWSLRRKHFIHIPLHAKELPLGLYKYELYFFDFTISTQSHLTLQREMPNTRPVKRTWQCLVLNQCVAYTKLLALPDEFSDDQNSPCTTALPVVTVVPVVWRCVVPRKVNVDSRVTGEEGSLFHLPLFCSFCRNSP